MARKPLEHWLRQAIGDPEKAPIKAIALVHMTGSSKKELHVTKFAPGRTWTAEQLASKFRDIAETFCQDIPGVQTMQLEAMYADADEPQSFHPWIVSGQVDNHGIGTEPPTKEGKDMQMMRHQEVMTQGMMRERQYIFEGFKGIGEQLLSTVRELGSQLKDSRHTEFEALAALKEVLVSGSVEDRAAEMERLKYERATAERQGLIKLAGPVLNRITGREIVPQSTEDTALIDMMAEHMTPEIQQGLAAMLPPHLAGLVQGRIRKSLEQKREATQLAAEAGDEVANDAALVTTTPKTPQAAE